MSVLRVQFGKRVRYLREQLDLTQEGLAEKTHLSVDFIGMIERGERSPSFENIEKLAEALDVDVKDMFDFEKS